jgi:hypothetical protein
MQMVAVAKEVKTRQSHCPCSQVVLMYDGEGVIQIGCGCCVVDFPPFLSSSQLPPAFDFVCSRVMLMILEQPLLRSLEDALPSLTDMRFAERAPARGSMPRQVRQAINH